MSRDLDGYRLGRRIAVGGMAEIFEAESKDGARVVVKILLPQYARDPEIVRLLEHEGRLMQRLAHEGLVRVIDVRASGEEPFLVLEHVDGAAADEVLSRMQKRGERPTPAMAVALVLPLLDALAHVHGAKDESGAPLEVVHRDVTPHNVLITREGKVLLGDFGIARSSLRDARTRTGVIRGKLRYLAPEQATGSTCDARTDLYGVGVMLWEVLTGQAYLEGATEVECLRAAEQPVYRKPSSVEGVDPRFDRILEKILARFPEERPRHASKVRAELAKLADGLDLEEARAAWAREVSAIAGESVPAPIAKPAPRASLVPYAVGGVAIAALALAGYWGLVSEREERPIARTDARPPEIAEPVIAFDAGSRLEIAPRIEDPQPVAVDAGVRRTPRVRPTSSDPAPVPEPAPRVDLAPLRARLGELRAGLRARGILESDLPAAQRSALAAIEGAIDRADARDAEQRLSQLGPSLEEIDVDEPFVRAKLERVDARIRAARARGADTTEVERLSALALSDLLAGRHDATNRRLNQIIALLDRAR